MSWVYVDSRKCGSFFYFLLFFCLLSSLGFLYINFICSDKSRQGLCVNSKLYICALLFLYGIMYEYFFFRILCICSLFTYLLMFVLYKNVYVFSSVNTAKSHTTKGVRLASNMQKTVDRIEVQSKDLRERIEALKRKIKQTRQYASSVSVPEGQWFYCDVLFFSSWLFSHFMDMLLIFFCLIHIQKIL